MKLNAFFDGILAWLDRGANQVSRSVARRTSRRDLLARLGAMIAGAATLPLLPVARAFASGMPEEMGNPDSCEYWRYCSLHGTLCSCCGGSYNSCPPGAEVSPVSWVGTCKNPVDDKDYLISYNDCCGQAFCPNCDCHTSERDKPPYYPPKSQNILWCFGTESRAYTCTIAVVIGDAPPGA